MDILKFLKNLFYNKSNHTNYTNIFAAKVLEVQKHPNADRLRIVKLSLGESIIEPVVCGAFNFKEGNIVPLALPGAKISQNYHSENHNPFILEKAKIRGIESQGMICSGFELGLSQAPEEGILILKNDIKPGSQFSIDKIK
jgi:phenylalanyl-tRNA synthetase beta chain